MDRKKLDSEDIAKGILSGLVTKNVVENADMPLFGAAHALRLLHNEKGEAESEKLIDKYIDKKKVKAVRLFDKDLKPTLSNKIKQLGKGDFPFVFHPHGEGNSIIYYDRSPYATAHEIGHLVDGKNNVEKNISSYIGRIKNELSANRNAFNILKKEFGTLKALKHIPASIPGLATYTFLPPLFRIRKTSLAPIIPIAVGALVAHNSLKSGDEE